MTQFIPNTVRIMLLSSLCLIVSNDALARPLPAPKWTVAVGKDVGPITTAGDYLLYGTTSQDQKVAEFHCRHLHTGKLQWKYKSPRLKQNWLDRPRNAIRSKALVKKHRVVCYSNRAEILCFDLMGLANGDDGEPEDQFHTGTSDLIWSMNLREMLGVFKRDSAEYGMPPINPLIFNSLVVCPTGNSSTLGIQRFYKGLLTVPSPQAPALVGIRLEDGELIWESNAPYNNLIKSASASPLIIQHGSSSNLTRELLFPAGDGCLYRINPESGKTTWNSSEENLLYTEQAPVDCGETIAVIARAPHSLPKSDVNTFIAGFAKFDLQESDTPLKPKWKLTFPQFSGAVARAFSNNGTLYVLCESGELYAIQSTSGEVLSKKSLGDAGNGYVELAHYKNMLFIPEEFNLVCAEMKQTLPIIARYDWKCSQEGQLHISGDKLITGGTGELSCYELNRLGVHIGDQ